MTRERHKQLRQRKHPTVNVGDESDVALADEFKLRRKALTSLKNKKS